MRNTTKLMVAGAAATGLLLSACEIPGSGPPLDTPAIVTPNLEGRTEFSGFPAIFKGTNIIQPEGEVGTDEVLSAYDAFTTTVDEESVTFECLIGGEETYVYIDSGPTDDQWSCADGPFTVTLAGSVYIEVHTYGEPGFYPYSVRATLDDQVVES